MIKQIAKYIISLTPYEIRKKKKDPLKHNTPEEMDRFFADQKKTKKYISLERNKLYRYILDCLPDDNSDVVDFGCGPGFFLKNAIAAKPKNNYFGYEYSKEAVRNAAICCPQAVIYHHDLRNTINAVYDIGVCSQTLEHILYPEYVFKNILNSINPSGKLILTVPDGRYDRYEGHINFWSEQSWEAWVKSNILYLSLKPNLYFTKLESNTGFDFLISIIDFS